MIDWADVLSGIVIGIGIGVIGVILIIA